VAANPKYKEAQFGLGKAELALGRPGDAKVTLERAIALDPNYVQAHYVLGRVLKRLSLLEDAKREIATAEQIQAKQRAKYARKLESEEHP
jgi:Tfp pilus assembly protein PilF